MADTIFALATAPGKAGVSIIRISGPDAVAAARSLGAVLDPMDRRVVRLSDADGALIDQAFALSFPVGKSFTGEAVVELHLHGSPAIVAAVQGRLSALGLRAADPGEFTRRALENGRLDLAQVEGLADLIDAETEEQRRQAVRVFDGALGEKVQGWRASLVRAAALLEATIDFAEEDVPEDVFPEVQALLRIMQSDLAKEVAGAGIRERVRDGFEVAIVGPPNIGKSTLLNRLAGREAAITSEYAGTTRDVIEVRMDLAGLPVTFLDTAGIRDAMDEIEEIGITRGLERAARADIRVHIVPIGGKPLMSVESGDIVRAGKADLLGPIDAAISGVSGQGIDGLIEEIQHQLRDRLRSAGVATRARHAHAMTEGLRRVELVLGQIETQQIDQVDFLAEELRLTLRSLDSLVGQIDVESLLDEIFSSFCIGK